MIILKEWTKTPAPRYDIYYHATFNAYLPSIKQYGLGARQNKNWEFSEEGKTYWSNSPEVAESYCETSEEVSDEVYDSGIVILSIPIKELRGVEKDLNVQDSLDDEIITSTGVIPFQKLTILQDFN